MGTCLLFELQNYATVNQQGQVQARKRELE